MLLGVSKHHKSLKMTTRSRKESANKKTRRLSQNDIILSLDLLRELTVCQNSTVGQPPEAKTVHRIDLQYSGSVEGVRPPNSLSRRLQGSTSNASAKRARARTPCSPGPVSRHSTAVDDSKDESETRTHRMHVQDFGSNKMTSPEVTSRAGSSKKSPRRQGERLNASSATVPPEGWWSPRIQKRLSEPKPNQLPPIDSSSRTSTSKATTPTPHGRPDIQAELWHELQPQVMTMKRKPGMKVHSLPAESYHNDPVLPRLRSPPTNRSSVRMYVHTWLSAGCDQPQFSHEVKRRHHVKDTANVTPSREYRT